MPTQFNTALLPSVYAFQPQDMLGILLQWVKTNIIHRWVRTKVGFREKSQEGPLFIGGLT